jgi:hypothetical protein
MCFNTQPRASGGSSPFAGGPSVAPIFFTIHRHEIAEPATYWLAILCRDPWICFNSLIRFAARKKALGVRGIFSELDCRTTLHGPVC